MLPNCGVLPYSKVSLYSGQVAASSRNNSYSAPNISASQGEKSYLLLEFLEPIVLERAQHLWVGVYAEDVGLGLKFEVVYAGGRQRGEWESLKLVAEPEATFLQVLTRHFSMRTK